MRIKHFCFLLTFLLFIVSCESSKYITVKDINTITPDAKEYEVLKNFKTEFVYDAAALDNLATQVKIYRKVDYMKEAIAYLPIKHFMYDYFIVAFKNNKLFYWGFLDDFKKSDEKNIQAIGEKVADKLMETNK